MTFSLLPIERERLQRVHGAVHAVAWLLVLLPLLEITARNWPPQPGVATWRFAAATFVMNGLTTPLLGLALGTLLAAAQRQRGLLVAYGTTSLVLGVACLAWIGLFGLDALQTRAQVTASALREFDVMAVKSLVAGVLNGVVGGWLGMASVRAARVLRDEAAAAADDRASKLVVGRAP